MYYSLSILKKKNAQFYLVWKLAHNGNVSKKEIENVDIDKYCRDLKNYIPVGSSKDLRGEVKTKMSLYLLAVLYYGIVVTHHKKVEVFLSRLEHLLNSLKPQVMPPVKKRPPLHEEVDNSRPKKRRRTMQILEFEGDPLLALTDDQYRQINRQITLPDDVMEERPLDADELIAQLEREMYPQDLQEQQNQDSFFPNLHQEEFIPPFEGEMVLPINDENSYEGEMRRNSLMDFDVTSAHITHEAALFMDTANRMSIFELDAGPLHEDNSVEIDIGDHFNFFESSNGIVLPPIEVIPRNTAGRRNPPTRRFRHNDKIIFDVETSLSDVVIKKGLKDVAGNTEPLRKPIKHVGLKITQWFNIESRIPNNVLERYEQLLECAEEGKLRGELNFFSPISSPSQDRRSKEAESGFRPEDTVPQVHPDDEMIPQEEQLPVDHQVPIMDNIPEADESLQQRRRSSAAPSVSHGRPSYIEQPQADILDETRENLENMPPQGNEEMVERGKTPQRSIIGSPIQEIVQEERGIRAASPSDSRFDLHRRIFEETRSRDVVYLDDVFTDPHSVAGKAKDFFNLLWLLKEQRLSTEQDEPYGRIRLFRVQQPTDS